MQQGLAMQSHAASCVVAPLVSVATSDLARLTAAVRAQRAELLAARAGRRLRALHVACSATGTHSVGRHLHRWAEAVRDMSALEEREASRAAVRRLERELSAARAQVRDLEAAAWGD